MKRALFVLCTLCSLLANAYIIVTRSNGNVEDVTVVSITADEVSYMQNGKSKSVISTDVEGILYDDGRYVTPPARQLIQNEAGGEIPAVEQPTAETNTEKKQQERDNVTNHQNKRIGSEGSNRKKIIPQACYKEADKIYKEVFKEAYDRALQQGYSKMQAAFVAADEAVVRKKQILEECYNQRVVQYNAEEEKPSSTPQTTTTVTSGDNW